MAKIADAFSIIRNGANIKQGLDDSGYPITRIETISNRTVDRNKMGYAGVTDISKYFDYVLQNGDILMSHINSETHLGKVALYKKQEDETIIHGMNLLCLRPKKELLDSRYAFYYLSSDAFLRQIPRITKKSVNQASFNVAALKELTIPIPEIEKQRDIVRGLDKVSELIVRRKEQLAKLDELVKSRFIELFGDCLTNPKCWKTKCLEDIAEVGSSKRVFVEELQEEGIPFYRGTEVGALAEGKQIIPELFITEQHYVELCEATGAPQVGDLLMPSICPDGRIWVVNTDKPFYFKDGRVLWVHAIDASYNSVFLLYTLKDRIMTDYSSIASGTTFAELKIFALKKCRVFDVPITLQNQFAAFVEQTDKSKLVIQQSLDKLELMKKALMQKYFG